MTSPQGRFADAAEAVSGRVLRTADAWGKHLFHHYEGGAVVHVHLGLYGKFTERPVPLPDPVGQVRMRMVGAEYGTDLRGPTACEVIHQVEVDDIVARLGPDPLRRDAGRLLERVGANQQVPQGDRRAADGPEGDRRGRQRLPQRVAVSGTASSRTGPAPTSTEAEFDDAWTDLVALMKVGVSRGKIITVRRERRQGPAAYRARPAAHATSTGATGEPCRVCGTPIRTEVMEARNLFWCPTCQT